jgi:hypothetical protein
MFCCFSTLVTPLLLPLKKAQLPPINQHGFRATLRFPIVVSVPQAMGLLLLGVFLLPYSEIVYSFCSLSSFCNEFDFLGSNLQYMLLRRLPDCFHHNCTSI